MSAKNQARNAIITAPAIPAIYLANLFINSLFFKSKKIS